MPSSRLAPVALVALLLAHPAINAQEAAIALDLPKAAVARRATLVTQIAAGEKKTYANLEGPGCIRHIWTTMSRNDDDNRNLIIRIYFDGEPTPYVEAPFGDFFAAMHGKAWYPVNTPLLSVQSKSGYNSYFAMPFARSARVEFEAGERPQTVYCMVDWHSYPNAQLAEKRRFCARWRREFPTQRYGEDFLMLDADGPGQLLGFVYGVRLIDNVDRWSHGGADNIYLDGMSEHPSYLRGIGGEDTFGTSYGGSLHTPTTHLYASMPFYEHIDDGTARPTKLITGYRWFTHDAISFEKSVHMRFGCMSNDICSTVYWYQEKPVRPFFKMPAFPQLAAGLSSKEIARGTHDLPLPNSGHWWVSEVKESQPALSAARSAVRAPIDVRTWTRRAAMHGFIDFGHVHRPHKRGAGVFHEATACAACVLNAGAEMTAKVQIAWDDVLVLAVDDQKPMDLGHRDNFGARMIDVPLKKGANRLSITLSNTRNFNHGGWAFAFRAVTPNGVVLIPETPEASK